MISAVVPTYRGGDRLRGNLPSLIAALEAAGTGWEIIVVDDGGGDLGSIPSGVRILELPENRGYGPAVNAGVAAAAGDLILVLNDDVALEQPTVAQLGAHFPDAELFAVAPAIRSPLARCGDEGGKVAVWTGGLMEIGERPASRVQTTLYPIGCCFLAPRSLFLDLGGYDEIYRPFFWEDVDLGYRAWRRGLRVLHDPAATCRHQGSATIAAMHPIGERVKINFRNQVLFHLLNLKDRQLRDRALGALLAHAAADASPERGAGLGEALERFASTGPRNEPGLGDEEILKRVDAG